MAYKYYIKNYSLQEMELYFESIPPSATRMILKRNRWTWNPTKGCWTTYLCSEAEKIAKSIGAIDGTTPYSNPATNAEQMKLALIRDSMSETFNSSIFQSYSLKEIKAYLNTVSGPKPKYVDVFEDSANAFVVLLTNRNGKMATIGITDDLSKVDEQKRIYNIEDVFAQKLLRCILFCKSYILYKNEVYWISGISNTEMIRQIIKHTEAFNKSDPVDIWVYRLKRPCCVHKDSVQSVTWIIHPVKS